jgi:hypothetical protein
MKESTTTGKSSDRNQGEGDKESARRYNEQQRAFVNSDEGQRAIEDAGEVAPEEEAALERAEEAGKSRAKGEDPAVTRRS